MPLWYLQQDVPIQFLVNCHCCASQVLQWRQRQRVVTVVGFQDEAVRVQTFFASKSTPLNNPFDTCKFFVLKAITN